MTAILGQIPNLLTLLRIAAAPVLILLLLSEDFQTALILFLVAGITDSLDGFIAKRFNCVTELGARLDPLADKILIISAYCMLTWLELIPFELVLLVIFRDIVIVGGYMVLTLDDEVPMNPTIASKLNTLLQITYVLAILVEHAEWVMVSPIDDILLWLVVVTTVVTGVQYVWEWAIRRSYREAKADKAE